MRKLLGCRFLPVVSSLIHPILFAVFPPVFLYAHNIGEASAGDVLKPILVLSAGMLIIWLLLSLLLKSTLKAGLATTIFAILFSFYGRFYDLLSDWDSPLAKHAYLFPTTLLVWGYCTYFISILKIDLKHPTRILNVVAIVLVVMNVATVTLHATGKRGVASGGTDVASEAGDAVDIKSMPDIYYIVLDEYAHPDTMQEYYGYDCSDFISSLVDKGFLVATDSRITTSETWRSIASSLNMEEMSATVSREGCFQKIADSLVAKKLQCMGYTYVYFGNWFQLGRYEVNADVTYNFYESYGKGVDEFSRTLWNTTMAAPFYDHLYLTESAYGEYYRSSILETIRCLKTMPDLEGPKFVFAHILSPHMPFVFGSDGESIDTIDWYNTQDRRFYSGQYEFISREIEGLVTALLEKSSSDPVIIIQSDHGPRPGPGGSGCPGIKGSEWPKILNAYHLPGNGSDDLNDSISPTDSFRVIFNHYLGADYDVVE